jgi:hypothetical protein
LAPLLLDALVVLLDAVVVVLPLDVLVVLDELLELEAVVPLDELVAPLLVAACDVGPVVVWPVAVVVVPAAPPAPEPKSKSPPTPPQAVNHRPLAPSMDPSIKKAKRLIA